MSVGWYQGLSAILSVDPLTLVVASAAIFLIAFMKGAFGGGFAIIGIPLLALVMDPIAAGVLLAPLFIAMDVVALPFWRPSTWSRPDLAALVPGQLAGLALGFLALSFADRDMFAIAIAVITLLFAGQWFMGRAKIERRPRSYVKGVLAGFGSGVAAMIAHSGGPPVAMYLLPLGLPKSVYAGTMFVFFVISNLLKVGPWLVLAPPGRELWWLMALCLPASVLGVWAGWRAHERLDEKQLYRACYGLLVVVAVKLLWDGLRGYGVL